MAAVSSILLSLSLVLAVVLGPQTRPWSWGPSLVALSLSLLTAIPVLWKNRRPADTGFLVLGTAAIFWFCARAAVSPVKEYAVSDLLLLCAVAGSFVVIRAIAADTFAMGVFRWSCTLLVLANVVVMFIQNKNPDFSPVLVGRPVTYPSGFYGHYNEAANFLVGASLLLAGSALSDSARWYSRAVWAGTALLGLSSTYLTHSRGGILSAAIAAGIFTLLVLCIGWRDHKKWFTPLAISLPACGLLAGYFLLQGWQAAQQVRSESVSVDQVLDNSIRLHLWDIAFSCFSLHPWSGGGSRSYGWECYRFWNYKDHGWQQFRPEFAHNELIQSITDYGLIGAILIVAVLIFLCIRNLLRLINRNAAGKSFGNDALAVGGICAIGGMLVQSSFSFVFHLFPGALLLGVCLGHLSAAGSIRRGRTGPTAGALGAALIFAAFSLAIFGMFFGIQGSRVTAVLWSSTFHSPRRPDIRTTADHLAEAIRIWPQGTLFKERALMLHRLVGEELESGTESTLVTETIHDYSRALELNPFDPTAAINLANVLSHVGRDDEALEQYRRAIELQGGMEMSFKGHFKASNHLRKMGWKKLREEDPENAFQLLSQAEEEFRLACEMSPALDSFGDGIKQRASIYEGLGMATEANGDFEGALETFGTLAGFGSGIGNYRAGALLARMADAAYQERRPARAHRLFIEAREKLSAASELPAGTTGESKQELLDYIGEMIRFFETTGVRPEE